jgi:hypothetical protein
MKSWQTDLHVAPTERERFVIQLYKQVAPDGALNRLPYSPTFRQSQMASKADLLASR